MTPGELTVSTTSFSRRPDDNERRCLARHLPRPGGLTPLTPAVPAAKYRPEILTRQPSAPRDAIKCEPNLVTHRERAPQEKHALSLPIMGIQDQIQDTQLSAADLPVLRELV
jgi:hypothetical protein